jgi:hypothetical protein
MHYPHTVTFQEPVITRLPSGQESRTYADAPSLTDLPARIIPVIGTEGTAGASEEATERMVLEEDLFTIVVQGDRAIERPMRMVSDYLGLDLSVVRVQRPVLYRSAATDATLVTAERITTGIEDGQS